MAHHLLNKWLMLQLLETRPATSKTTIDDYVLRTPYSVLLQAGEVYQLIDFAGRTSFPLP